MQHNIMTPQVNANDDEVKIVEWRGNIGDHVRGDQALVVVETAKAAVELEPGHDGYLRWQAGTIETLAPVGSALAILTDAKDEVFEIPAEPAQGSSEEQDTSGVDGRGPTLKARILAKKLGVPLDLLMKTGESRITEESVRSFARDRAAASECGEQTGVLAEDPLVIAGDSAHARYMYDTCRRAGYVNIAGCVSLSIPAGEMVGAMKVLGNDDDLPAIYESGTRNAVIGVGSSRSGRRSNDVRCDLFSRLKSAGYGLPVVIDPAASVSGSAVLGEGSVVGAGAVVSANVLIGRNVLVNVGSIVCHDCVIEDHVHITPGAVLAGSVQVGEGSTIGMCATVLDGVRVGRECLVPNGCRVIHDLPDGTVAR